MKKDLHNIDKLFKAALEDHTQKPPERVWDAIDKRLDKNKVVDINKKYLQLKRFAVSLLVLLVGLGAYTLNHWTKINNAGASNTTSNKNERAHNQLNTAPALTDAKNKTVVVTESIKTTKTPEDNTFTLPNSKAKQVEKETIKSLASKQNVSAESTDVTTNKENNATGKTSIFESKVPEEKPKAAQNNTETIKNTLVNKRKLKTTFTNGSLEEIDKTSSLTASIKEITEKTGSNAIMKEEERTAGHLAPIAFFYPQPLSGAQVSDRQDRIGSDKNVFLNESGLTSGPVKKQIIKNAGALSATIFFAPNISSDFLKEEPHERSPGGGLSSMDHDDKDKIRKGELRQSSYSLGVLLDYNLNKHWSVQSGVSFTSKTIHINPKTIYADKDDQGEIKYRFNCSSGYTFLSSTRVANPLVGDSLQASYAINTLQYISVPLALKYHYYLNKFDLFATTGTAFNMLTKSKITTEIGNVNSKEVSTSSTINGLKSNYFSGNIGLGLSYSVTRSIALSFMPSYNFAINSSTRDATIKTYPNNFSLAAGIRYKL